ncbi:MAG: TM2 domain-containing protein [Candidatus Cloacimonetes bacterium]|jgi:TM2 domain-containing membrane protein YozV|nr:TM2 domain-containing protein [Candidatus Cloacimonadota bacterium]
MKGQILDYSIQSNTGIITGDDENRYNFSGSEWKSDTPPSIGLRVDFETQEKNALGIYVIQNTLKPAVKKTKDKLVAGLLAIFLGWLGAHKFYLGFTGPGLVYLILNTAGWLVTWIMLGIPNWILTTIALIEGVIYLTKSDEEFEETYVIKKKQWF